VNIFKIIYTFIHHEGSKYMKNHKKDKQQTENYITYMTGREIDRRKTNL